MASTRTESWITDTGHGQSAHQTILQQSPNDGAVNANEISSLVATPDQSQVQAGNTVQRAILPNSFSQRPPTQQPSPTGPPGYAFHPQPSQLLGSNERYPGQYRSDASPRLYSSATNQYNSADIRGKPDMMAATQSQMGPTLASYPQAQSPTAITSPGHSAGRPLYASTMQPPAQFYYQGYIPHPQSHYAYNPNFQQTPLPTQHHQYPMATYQQPHPLQQTQSPPQHYATNYESAQTPQPGKIAIRRTAQSQSTGAANTSRASQQGQTLAANASPSSAPGPIRATTPTVVKQDNDGVTTISFEYSKDRVKRPYQIRCDVETVNLKDLTKEHKEENCVYPRACSGETYKGNRWQYENECNEVAWALAYLNPELKGKRGLIQRAVDSWRNSNKDKKLRSRRVKRLAKTERRAKMHQLHQEQQQYQHDTKKAQSATFVKPGAPMMPGSVPVSNGVTQPDVVSQIDLPQYHHHTVHSGDGSQTGNLSATGTSYGDTKSYMPSYQP